MYHRTLTAILILGGLALLAYGIWACPPGVIDYSVITAAALCFLTGCTLINVELKLPRMR